MSAPRAGQGCSAEKHEKLSKWHGCAKKITTDGLRCYEAAMKEIGVAERQEMGRWANNRVENSHLPFRRRERAMLRFRRMKILLQFASVHASFHNHLNQEVHLVSRQTRTDATPPWPSGAPWRVGLTSGQVAVRLTAPPACPSSVRAWREAFQLIRAIVRVYARQSPPKLA
jgi:anti-sigma factor RsiW